MSDFRWEHQFKKQFKCLNCGNIFDWSSHVVHEKSCWHKPELGECTSNYHEQVRKRKTELMITKYDRALPLDEMCFDRWKRAELLKFGEGTGVYENSYIYGLSNLSVGKNCWIGPMTIIDASGGRLEIGNGVSIACGAMIFTHSAHMFVVTEGKSGFEKGPIKIGNNSFIGSGAVVLPGVTIGDHSVIGAGAVVESDIPSNSIAVGIPAKVIKNGI